MPSETLRKWVRRPRSVPARRRGLPHMSCRRSVSSGGRIASSSNRNPQGGHEFFRAGAHLNRQGIPVAKCTIERLNRAHGCRGAARGPPGAHRQVSKH
jgi:hypothetical protein